ncbi:hypothetical protein, partial [Phascolarctobacterium succinatutens]|uniref:hypothetical protein n=1 Tax=Phascolarctobacterium succinatutens TaxID=626940 RepID=UPI00307E4D8C
MNTKEKISKMITKAETILQAGEPYKLVDSQDNELCIGDIVSWNVVKYNRITGECSTEKLHGILYGICGGVASVSPCDSGYMLYIEFSR